MSGLPFETGSVTPPKAPPLELPDEDEEAEADADAEVAVVAVATEAALAADVGAVVATGAEVGGDPRILAQSRVEKSTPV